MVTVKSKHLDDDVRDAVPHVGGGARVPLPHAHRQLHMGLLGLVPNMMMLR